MITPFTPGEIRQFRRLVTREHLAVFESGPVHPVYSTFALARDAEWACRLFVLEMKEEHEEGIGTFLSVEHRSVAREGQLVLFTAILVEIDGNRIRCRYEAHVEERLIATGEQEQRILERSRVEQLLRG
jgi:fluoroacetyl-CoA thioesterase